MAADMSVRLGWIDADLAQRAKTLLERAKLPTEPPEGVGIEKFKSLMAVSVGVLVVLYVRPCECGMGRVFWIVEHISFYRLSKTPTDLKALLSIHLFFMGLNMFVNAHVCSI